MVIATMDKESVEATTAKTTAAVAGATVVPRSGGDAVAESQRVDECTSTTFTNHTFS